jgi:hypothetical protein
MNGLGGESFHGPFLMDQGIPTHDQSRAHHRQGRACHVSGTSCRNIERFQPLPVWPRSPPSRVYRERLRFPAFRAQWQDALAEGYARLEAELLAEALRPASGNLKDITLKSRQMKVRAGG